MITLRESGAVRGTRPERVGDSDRAKRVAAPSPQPPDRERLPRRVLLLCALVRPDAAGRGGEEAAGHRRGCVRLRVGGRGGS